MSSSINSSRDRVMGSMSIEEYQALQSRRESTIISKEYIEWMKVLNVSQSYEDPSGKIRAGELMSGWGSRN